VNVAVIGTGMLGQFYARICSQMSGVAVVALCDSLAERVEPLATTLGAGAYPDADYRRMLAEHPEIDGVVVCTPEDSHVDPALAVLEAGKHILVEKPLAVTVDGARRIVQAAGESDVITMMGYSLRFDARYAAMKHAVAGGEVGDVIHISARRNADYSTLTRLGGRVELPFWIGVHDIDMMRWITRSEVRQVSAIATEKGFGDWGVKGAFFTHLIFHNGVVATLENAWQTRPVFGRPHRATFKVQGTKGLVEVNAYEQGVTVYGEEATSVPDTVYRPRVHGRITGVHPNQIAYFVDCLRRRERSDIPVEEGLQGVMVAEAILKSANQGRGIVLPPQGLATPGGPSE
jgi:predicted dehydrogenase